MPVSKKYYVPIDLTQLELLNARIHNDLDSPSNSPVEGQIYMNTSTHKLMYYNGSAWVALEAIPAEVSLPNIAAGTSTPGIIAGQTIKSYVTGVVAAVEAMRFKGTVGTGGDISTLPTTDVKVGDTYMVATAGTYASQVCEVGDLIIATATTPTWTVVQTNLNGAITGSGTSGYLTKWDGSGTVTNGPQLGSDTSKYLRNDGSFVVPPFVNGNARVFYGTSNTGADYDNKAVTCATYDAYTAGDIIIVNFSTANNSPSPALNVNSKGNKTIKQISDGSVSNLSNKASVRGTCVFVYDGTYMILISSDDNTTYSNASSSASGLMSAASYNRLWNMPGISEEMGTISSGSTSETITLTGCSNCANVVHVQAFIHNLSAHTAIPVEIDYSLSDDGTDTTIVASVSSSSHDDILVKVYYTGAF